MTTAIDGYSEWTDANKNIITNICSPGEWFRFPRQFLKIMSANQALVLCELLNESTLANMDEDGWFRYSVKKFEERMFMNDQAQKRAIRKLEEMHIIERSICAKTNQRLIRIYYDVIYKLLNEGESVESERYTHVNRSKVNDGWDRKQTMGGVENERSTTIEKEREKEDTMPPSGGRPDGEVSSDAFEESSTDQETNQTSCFAKSAAKTLYNELRRKKYLRREVNLSTWVKVINRFFKKTDVTKEEFKTLLQWYLAHMGDNYMPKVRTASDFCNKFEMIEDAKRKSECHQTNGHARELKIHQQNTELLNRLYPERNGK